MTSINRSLRHDKVCRISWKKVKNVYSIKLPAALTKIPEESLYSGIGSKYVPSFDFFLSILSFDNEICKEEIVAEDEECSMRSAPITFPSKYSTPKEIA